MPPDYRSAVIWFYKTVNAPDGHLVFTIGY